MGGTGGAIKHEKLRAKSNCSLSDTGQVPDKLIIFSDIPAIKFLARIDKQIRCQTL